MELYRRAQDQFDATLASVPADRWDVPSACAEWTVRDIAGHVAWAQNQLRAWATGEEYPDRSGAPGSAHPAGLAGADPVATWRAAREKSVATLSKDTLDRTTPIPGLGDVPLIDVVSLLVTDTVAHTWDIGHALGATVHIEPPLVAAAFEWAQANVVRRPGFFGPALEPPADADDQTRMLAYLGRAPWQPVGSA